MMLMELAQRVENIRAKATAPEVKFLLAVVDATAYYNRTCVQCKFARVEIVPEDRDPMSAATFCGNEDSPAYDRDVSFFGDDTCGHWVKGHPSFVPDDR